MNTCSLYRPLYTRLCQNENPNLHSGSSCWSAILVVCCPLPPADPQLPARETLHTLPSTTHATLQSSGPPLDAYLTRSNTFNFHNVSAGSYLATVHCRDFAFEPLRIDVVLEETVEGSGEHKEIIRAWQTFLGNEWDNKGEARVRAVTGWSLKPGQPSSSIFIQSDKAVSLSRISMPLQNLNRTSCPVVIPEEPYDTHGHLFHGSHLRYAQVDGK